MSFILRNNRPDRFAVPHSGFRKSYSNNVRADHRASLLVHVFASAADLQVSWTLRSNNGSSLDHILFCIFATNRSASAKGLATPDIR